MSSLITFYKSDWFYPLTISIIGGGLGVISSPLVAIFLAIVVPILSFLIYAFMISPSVNSPAQFFLAGESLNDKDVYETLAATWLLLGNVTVANMLLGAYFGFYNWWLIATWALAFTVAGLNAERISDKLGEIHTLHEFLGVSYDTPFLRVGAAFVTFFVSMGILALELVVGMGIVLPITEGSILISLIVGFAFVLVISAYCVLGGLKAVVDTDRPQVGAVIAAMIGLVVLAMTIWFGPNADSTTFEATVPAFPFWIGLFFLQVPLLVGDFGTWQRIRATNPAESGNLLSAFQSVGWLNIALWTAMVLGGMALSTVETSTTYDGLAANLYTVAEPVVKAIDVSIASTITLGGWASTAIVFVFTTGLICAMLSSADSYLLIGLQTITEDVFRLGRPNKLDEEGDASSAPSTDRAVRWSRSGAALAAFVAYGVAVILIYTGQQANALDIVFIVFGSQTVLSPLAVFALRDDLHVPQYSGTAIIAGVLGFVLPFGYGIWSLVQNTSQFHSTWGAYLTPVGAVLIPTIFLIADTWRKEGFYKAFRLISGYWGSYN